jgi:hypothetical protein
MLKHASQNIRNPTTPNSPCVSVRAAGMVERFRRPQPYGMPAAQRERAAEKNKSRMN